MPILLTILPFLRTNWKIIALISGLIIFGLWCYNKGGESVQAEWDAAIFRTQKEANEKSVKLEADLAIMRAKNLKTNAKLERAIHANADYSNCHVTPDGLFALREAIATR